MFGIRNTPVKLSHFQYPNSNRYWSCEINKSMYFSLFPNHLWHMKYINRCSTRDTNCIFTNLFLWQVWEMPGDRSLHQRHPWRKNLALISCRWYERCLSFVFLCYFMIINRISPWTLVEVRHPRTFEIWLKSEQLCDMYLGNKRKTKKTENLYFLQQKIWNFMS